MIWPDEYLNHLLKRSEIEFSTKIPSIFARRSLDVSQGVSVYDISAFQFINIQRVTWKGDRVEPWEHAGAMHRSDWLRPQNQAFEGLPKFYLSYEYGYAKIKFHPIPNETIAADDTTINGADIENRVIISGYVLADPDGTAYRIPEYVRRRFTKYYAMSHAYLREGPGQDIQAANYFDRKYQLVLSHLKMIINSIPKSVRIQMGERSGAATQRIPRPTLPTSGPWSF